MYIKVGQSYKEKTSKAIYLNWENRFSQEFKLTTNERKTQNTAFYSIPEWEKIDSFFQYSSKYQRICSIVLHSFALGMHQSEAY